jgi:hypothetical protein
MRGIGITAFAAGLLICGAASAVEIIGNSIKVTPAAFSEGGDGDEPLVEGSDVHRDAFVRTGKGGATTLRFKDESELTIGPRSRVKLDRFVYADDTTFANAGVMMLKGSFRWATGHSPKPAYDLRTPTASIGIRGTVLDLRVSADFTRITVIEGAIRACASESTACIDATPETGPVRITRTKAEIDQGEPARLRDASPKKDPPAPRARPKQKKAEAAPPKPRRIREAKAKTKAPPPRKRHVIYIDEPETIYVEAPPRRRRPDITIGIGLGILGAVLDGPRRRYPGGSQE